MEKIYQRFDLDEKSITETLKRGTRVDFPAAARKLRSELVRRGYQVLETMNYINGVPTQIILGGERTLKHKNDFYELCGELKLPFSSGDFYIECNQTEKDAGTEDFSRQLEISGS